MEFISSDQIDTHSLNSIHFDIFIVAAGYEKRCTYLLKNYTISAENKYAIAFKEKFNELNRKRNNEFLKENGFTFLEISGTDAQSLDIFLSKEVFSSAKRDLKILVDYSCMTKLWYATIVNFFTREEGRFNSVRAYFSYTPASFSIPKRIKPAKKAEPIHVGLNKFDPSKQTALVIGLGHEKGRAEFLRKKVNPDFISLMYADPAPDNQYVENVFRMNQNIMNEVDVRNLINYPLNDINKINDLLTQLCLDLRLKYNVILAPLGPKLHALCCVLLATRFPDIDVWRVSAGSNELAYDRDAGSDPIVLEVDFTGDEEDF